MKIKFMRKIILKQIPDLQCIVIAGFKEFRSESIEGELLLGLTGNFINATWTDIKTLDPK